MGEHGQPLETRRIELCEAYAPLLGGNPGTRYVIVTGGRGSGKSFAVALCLALLLREPGYRILFTRYTLVSARDSIIPEFLAKVDLLGCGGEFDATAQDVTNTVSGSDILFRGIQTSSGNQTAKLKSLHGINVWVLDEAEEMADEDAFDKINLSVRDTRHPNLVVLALNPCHKAHWIYRRWFDGLPPEFCGVRNGVTYIHTTYEDNRPSLPGAKPHLPADILAEGEAMRLANPTRYNRVFRGHWAAEIQGALWTWEMIDRHRMRNGSPPDLARVVVAVDPAATSTERADETGIVCAGVGIDGHFYVLSDLTLRASPAGWAQAAVGEYRRRQADRIVGEVNNGGEMVEATLRNVGELVSYSAVHATRGKLMRAEPIAALYEQGRVHHIGTFPALETEMMTYAGREGEKSPNRLDALVWALTELSSGNRQIGAMAAAELDVNGDGDGNGDDAGGGRSRSAWDAF